MPGPWVEPTTVIRATDAQLWDAGSSVAIFNARSSVYTAGSDDATIANAANAMQTHGSGLLYLPGSWNCSLTAAQLVPAVSSGPCPYAVRGDGSGLSVINFAGNTPFLSLSNPSFSASAPSTGAPRWGGFTIDGTSASAGAAGLQIGDVSYGYLDDVEIRNFTAGDGILRANNYGWTEGWRLSGVRLTNNLNNIRSVVGVGANLGTITSTLSTGTAYTSIPVGAGVLKSLFSGQTFLVYSGSGTVSQNVTTSAAVTAGATSIPVNSFTPTVTLTSGTAKVTVGAYGSFDYWSVDSLYIDANANQDAISSEISLGLGQNMTQFGSRWRVTANMQSGAANTGAFLRTKGNDQWDPVIWDVTAESDGGAAVAHKSIVAGNGTNSFGGAGTFLAYFLDTPTFAGGTYQFNITGNVALKGLSDKGQTATGGAIRFMVDVPAMSNTEGGVRPTIGTGSTNYPATTIVSGTSFQNKCGGDVWVTLPITFTGTGTATVNVDTFSGLSANATMESGTTGQITSLTFKHYAGSYALVTVTNATIGTPVAQWA